MTSQKICIVDMNMTNHGGVEKVSANLANGLADYYNVILLSCCSKAEERAVYHLKKEVLFKNLGLENDRIRKMLPSFLRTLRKVCLLYEIDVMILQGHYLSFLGVFSGLFTKTKIICFDHGSITNQWDDKKAVFMRLVSAVFCDRLVTLTKRNRDDYGKIIHGIKKKICYIYNWVDENEDGVFRYNLDSKRIISAGRFTEEKGFDILIEAFAQVVKRHPAWELDIYGDGPLRQIINNRIDDLSVRENVHLQGMVNNLSEYYNNYAMYVLPSYREGMPMTLLEAKANWLPIVSFDILTGPREIVQDGINGILVPPNNLTELSNAICRLIEDQKLRYSMASHAQDNMELFLKKNIIGKWINLIDEIV